MSKIDDEYYQHTVREQADRLTRLVERHIQRENELKPLRVYSSYSDLSTSKSHLNHCAETLLELESKIFEKEVETLIREIERELDLEFTRNTKLDHIL